jgi:hypothetical protein
MSIKMRARLNDDLPFWFAMTSPLIGVAGRTPFGMAVGPGLKSLCSQQPLMRMITACRSSLARPFSSKRFTTYKNKIIASLSRAPAAHESHSALAFHCSQSRIRLRSTIPPNGTA